MARCSPPRSCARGHSSPSGRPSHFALTPLAVPRNSSRVGTPATGKVAGTAQITPGSASSNCGTPGRTSAARAVVIVSRPAAMNSPVLQFISSSFRLRIHFDL